MTGVIVFAAVGKFSTSKKKDAGGKPLVVPQRLPCGVSARLDNPGGTTLA